MLAFQDKARTLLRLWLDQSKPTIFSFHDCLPDVFSGYLELLITRKYRILSAAELLEGPRKPGRQAVLTFDDGRRNCWTVIFPLLKKYKIRASIFVIASRISDSQDNYPNLEDFWEGRVSWENLYLSHRKQPYLTWKELRQMRESGLIEVYSHGLRHEVVPVGSGIMDFQHPGVYEMPVYFDEWYSAGQPVLDSQWGRPVYERAWSPLATNAYCPDQSLDLFMNEFVKKNGGFLFFRKKRWRRKLFEYWQQHRRLFSFGHFRKNEIQEELGESLAGSRKIIEERVGGDCIFFSLPLYQGLKEAAAALLAAGYKGVFSGPQNINAGRLGIPVFNRIPGFWLKFLNYI
ncbi:MAG: polysaccharide deacetylase family protein [Candidatus Omnitrophota bacterium]